MSRPLLVVPPLAITDAMLVSSDVPEADYAVYSAGTTYGLLARVMVVAGDHGIYESLQASNTGNATPTLPDTVNAWWIRVSPTNRWKLFDTSNSTATAKATSMAYRLQPGIAVSCLSVLNITGATSIRVRVVDPTYGTVYDRTINLSPLPLSSGWYQWFFGVRRALSLALFTDLPSFPTADVLVDIAGGATLAVGTLILGQTHSLGFCVEAGVRAGIRDFSVKQENGFGDLVVIERAFSKRVSFDVRLAKADIDAAHELLSTLRATPCLWIASSEFACTVVFGFFKDFDVLIQYSTLATCSLQLEGLT